MNYVLRLLGVIVSLAAPAISQAQKAEMPEPTAFVVGDTWVWRQVDNRTKLEEALLARTVVIVGGILRFSSGRGNSQVSTAFVGNPSRKPWRVWPLEVGKKWAYDEDWTRRDGVTGNTQQDAQVVAYEEVTVPAGKFMAFKIEHQGWYRTSQGGSGRQLDTSIGTHLTQMPM